MRVAGWSLSILRHPLLMKPPCAPVDLTGTHLEMAWNGWPLLSLNLTPQKGRKFGQYMEAWGLMLG